jgi:hypothetical protein
MSIPTAKEFRELVANQTGHRDAGSRDWQAGWDACREEYPFPRGLELHGHYFEVVKIETGGVIDAAFSRNARPSRRLDAEDLVGYVRRDTPLYRLAGITQLNHPDVGREPDSSGELVEVCHEPTYPQPDSNELASEVFQELMCLADKFESGSYFSAATALRELARTTNGPEIGYYWETIHLESGAAVNHGFTKGAGTMSAGVFPDALKGFERRVIAVYAEPRLA